MHQLDWPGLAGNMNVVMVRVIHRLPPQNTCIFPANLVISGQTCLLVVRKLSISAHRRPIKMKRVPNVFR